MTINPKATMQMILQGLKSLQKDIIVVCRTCMTQSGRGKNLTISKPQLEKVVILPSSKNGCAGFEGSEIKKAFLEAT
jgi:hypothetical protein